VTTPRHAGEWLAPLRAQVSPVPTSIFLCEVSMNNLTRYATEQMVDESTHTHHKQARRNPLDFRFHRFKPNTKLTEITDI
jgi:hypothetical protein